MKIHEWKEGMSPEEAKDGAYWERNMLALYIADYMNYVYEELSIGAKKKCGWYYDTDNNWDGWKRVISIYDGSVTFHIPDDFDVGSLPQIEPNWDGHSTREKWERIMQICDCKVE